MLNTHNDDTNGLKLRSRPEFSCAGKKLSTYWDHRSHYNKPNDNDSNICQLMLFKSWARKITDIARYSLNFSIVEPSLHTCTGNPLPPSPPVLLRMHTTSWFSWLLMSRGLESPQAQSHSFMVSKQMTSRARFRRSCMVHVCWWKSS